MSEVPAGLGVGWMDQALPFQASASVDPSRLPELAALSRPAPAMESPTAVQAVAERHETPNRVSTMEPAAFGDGLSFQELPFHTSVSVCQSSAGSARSFPTATQAVTAAQDT